MRKDAREIVFKVLFSELFSAEGNSNELLEDLYNEQKLSKADRAFATELYLKISENKAEFDEVLVELAKNYKLERIYSTDKCALYIGLCEMKYFDDVPNIVAIDEALALCKKYSTLKSLSFVNGIFAEYKRRIEEEKQTT